MGDKKETLKVNFENVDHSQYLIEYIRRRIQRPKFTNLKLTPENINIRKDNSKGDSKFVVTISIVVHKVKIFVRETGNNLYALIDAVVRKINRRLSKLKQNINFQNRKSLKYMM